MVPAADFDAFDSSFDFAMLSFFMNCVAFACCVDDFFTSVSLMPTSLGFGPFAVPLRGTPSAPVFLGSAARRSRRPGSAERYGRVLFAAAATRSRSSLP